MTTLEEVLRLIDKEFAYDDTDFGAVGYTLKVARDALADAAIEIAQLEEALEQAERKARAQGWREAAHEAERYQSLFDSWDTAYAHLLTEADAIQRGDK